MTRGFERGVCGIAFEEALRANLQFAFILKAGPIFYGTR